MPSKRFLSVVAPCSVLVGVGSKPVSYKGSGMYLALLTKLL